MNWRKAIPVLLPAVWVLVGGSVVTGVASFFAEHPVVVEYIVNRYCELPEETRESYRQRANRNIQPRYVLIDCGPAGQFPDVEPEWRGE